MSWWNARSVGIVYTMCRIDIPWGLPKIDDDPEYELRMRTPCEAEKISGSQKHRGSFLIR